MTISSEIRVSGPYLADGINTAFPFDFVILDKSDMWAILTDITGEETTLVENTDYTVTLSGDQDMSPGGTVTLTQAPPSGYKVTLTSNMPNLQPFDITNMGGFYPETIETALDRHTIQIQQLREEINRAIKVAISSPTEPSELAQAVQRLAAEMAALQTLVAGLGDISSVAGNITSINTVAGNIGNVTSVAGNMGNIDALAGIVGDLSAIAANLNAIESVSDNIYAIQNIQGVIDDLQAILNALNAALAAAQEAETSANNAAGSATAAGGYATSAGTYATQAAGSAANALGSETNAATSATQASTAKTAAETAATNVANLYDNFDARYLGAKTSNPTTDNDNNPLIVGALYWNTPAGEMRVWNGSAWMVVASGGFQTYTLSTVPETKTAGDVIYVVGFGMWEWVETAYFEGYRHPECFNRYDGDMHTITPPWLLEFTGGNMSKTTPLGKRVWSRAQEEGAVVTLQNWQPGYHHVADNGDGTFKLGDIRMTFSRAAAGAVDPDTANVRLLGSWQASANLAHVHASYSGGGGSLSIPNSQQILDGNASGTATGNESLDNGIRIHSSGGAEARPENTAYNPCIHV
ncbi:MAG: hypothetical protein LBE24_03980 [Methylobacillus sp.]|jgi:hypothetical protein|nr:hypothetical protein [Methylobacillus sp.]